MFDENQHPKFLSSPTVGHGPHIHPTLLSHTALLCQHPTQDPATRHHLDHAQAREYAIVKIKVK